MKESWESIILEGNFCMALATYEACLHSLLCLNPFTVYKSLNGDHNCTLLQMKRQAWRTYRSLQLVVQEGELALDLFTTVLYHTLL